MQQSIPRNQLLTRTLCNIVFIGSSDQNLTLNENKTSLLMGVADVQRLRIGNNCWSPGEGGLVQRSIWGRAAEMGLKISLLV